MPTITPVDKPVTNLGPSADSQAIQTAKQKAIAAFMGGSQQSGQPNTQQNQQSISPEDVSKDNTGSQTQEQVDTVEATTTAEATETKGEPPLSTQYAVLARKEKALRAKEIAFQQAQRTREAEWKTREEQAKSQAFDPSKYISIDDLKRNAYGKLQDIGVSYDELSTQALQAQSPEFQTIRQMREDMRQEMQQLRQEQDNIRKSSENQQAQAYQQALKQIEIEAKQLVFTDPAFDTVKNTNSVKQVVKLIERTFKDTGELLSVERAAELVEEELVEQGAQYAMLNKIQARLKSAAKSNNEKQQTSSPKQPQVGMKTLTNAVTNTRPLSARERALLAFKGESVK